MASDRRPYVRILDAVLREPWDDATLADIVRLAIWLNTRWARLRLPAAEAGRAWLGPQDMMLVTHTTNASRARARLLRIGKRTAGVTLAVSEATQGRLKGVNIDWPKFAIVQGYYDRDSPKLGGNSGETRSSASASASAPSKKKSDARASGRKRPASELTQLREILDADAAHEQRFHEARAQLKAEEDRDYSVAEIEARMKRAAS